MVVRVAYDRRRSNCVSDSVAGNVEWVRDTFSNLIDYLADGGFLC